MNCEDTPRTSPKCTCCEDCLRSRRERSRVNSSPTKSSTPGGRRGSSSKGDEGYLRNYAVPDEDYTERKERFSRCGNHRSSLVNRVDSSTLRTLSNLRHRACQLIDTSDGSNLSECDECKPCNRRESDPRDGPVRRRAQNLDYSPRSSFLKKIKRQNEDVIPRQTPNSCSCRNYSPRRCGCQADLSCQCCKCQSNEPTIASGTPRDSPRQRSGIKGRPDPYSDISSVHDHCTCFQTFRPRPSGDTVDYGFEHAMKDEDFYCGRNQIRGLNFGNDCDFGDSPNGEEKSPRKKKGKCGHVSRVDKKKGRSGRRRHKAKSRIGSESPECDFEPSLKRPHPNSCERCWRYASPSRSPVNKPSQRFDPNYRRSHSQINVGAYNNGRETSGGSEGTEPGWLEFDPETKVHQLMTPMDRRLVRTRSADTVNSPRPIRPQTAKYPVEKKPAKSNEAVGKSFKKEDTDTGSPRTPRNKKSQAKGESNQKTCVCFEDKKGKAQEKPVPVKCSPSILDKSSRKPTTSKKSPTASRPMTTTASGDKSKQKKSPPKQRPSSASPSQVLKIFQPLRKPRAQSFDREQCCGGDFKENFSTPPPGPSQLCSCCKSVDREARSPPLGRGGLDFAALRNSICRGSEDYSVYTGCPHGCFLVQPNFSRDCCGVCSCPSPPSPRNAEDRPRQSGGLAGTCNCGCGFNFENFNLDGSPSRRGEGLNGYNRRNSPPVWNAEMSPRNNGNKETNGGSGCCRRQSDGKNKGRSRNSVADYLNNPRKYCVFYMNRSKENKDDDVEVLIEELLQGKDWKESKTEALKEKMNRLKEHRLESMALRFQKGVTDKCKRQKSNRVIYF